MEADWYKDRVVYQVYPKSFKDTDGDGIGDLRGVIEKIDYIKELGVNTIWLNPIFVSPQVDNGYDIANYYAIDERLGSIEDFDELVMAAHERGIKVILDFVMNHTSDQHPWFKDACENKDSIYRNYYLWAKGKNGKLPNNWASFFGGSVWAKDPIVKDNYYFHLFDEHMPDLNWENPEVRHSMYRIAKFWIDHGIDGFRLDAFIHIAKADFKQDVPNSGEKGLKLAEQFYANLPAVQTYLHEFIQQIKSLKEDLFILGEAASANVNLAADYTNPQNGECDTVVTFRYFDEKKDNPLPNLPMDGQPFPLDFTKLKSTMVEWQKRLEGISYPVLYWNNHDMARILTKINVKESYAKDAAKMLATLMYLQRGVPCIYYGEELGMKSMLMSDIKDFHDQQAYGFYEHAIMNGYSNDEALKIISRAHKMAARGPMVWNNQEYGGFSTTVPWNYGKDNTQPVIEQLKDPASVLEHYRGVLKIKKQPLFIDGTYYLENTSDDLYVYHRILNDQEAIVICNLTGNEQKYESKEQRKLKCILSSGNISLNDNALYLGPYASGVFMMGVK